MKKILILCLAALAATGSPAQTTLGDILVAIETNNTGLQALRRQADAEKLGNLAETGLDDPEIGFNYLWGNPEGIGRRQDISVSQRLDLATLSGSKKAVGASRNALVEWQYRADRMDVLLSARLLMLDIVYCNALLAELDKLHTVAITLVDKQQKRLDKGEGNILELNNVKLDHSKTDAEIHRVSAEKDAYLAQLAGLNGGVPLALADTLFPATLLPPDFEAWYAEAAARNPILGYVKSEIELNRRQLALTRTQQLPSLSVGYMSEKTSGERYQGVALGMSVPLWNNRNKIRQAKADIVAAEIRELDAHRQYYARLQALYRRTVGLKESAEIFRSSLGESDNTYLLKKALDMGEISILDYLMQVGIYYDTMEKTLSAERDYHKALAELTAVTTLD